MIKFEYYGHSAFLIDTGEERLLFDPFLHGNPVASIKAKDVVCDYIFLSHAHFDHYGDTNKIANNNQALVVTTPEVTSQLPEGYAHIHAMNIGGSYEFPFGKVTMVQAIHSSGVEGGLAAGFVISFHSGEVVYYAGDTALFYEMKLIAKKFKLDYAILPIGDNYTMGPDDAARAARWLQVPCVIPVHYNTWPLIEQDPDHFRDLVEDTPVGLVEPHTPTVVQIVNPGDILELE